MSMFKNQCNCYDKIKLIIHSSEDNTFTKSLEQTKVFEVKLQPVLVSYKVNKGSKKLCPCFNHT